MKALFLLIIVCFLTDNGYSQHTRKFFYKTLLELTNNNDSINYYIIKLEVGKKGKIKNLGILFFKNDSISNMQMKNNISTFTLKDIISDSTFDYDGNNKNNLIICPYIIKKVKFIKNPNTDIVFSVLDINKIFILLKEVYASKRLNSRLVTPSILFIEESIY
jgi:hypothetical protein